ncbi:hypothetical protein HJFPF1_06668 [Paramyrothecium foliicola]|nr:hypothetical protein HJFPF1_06668 [Paramyrothecium foliicola]
MEQTLGTVVVFEGQQEVISTQLRLLPTSPQILILPSLESYLPSNSHSHGFHSSIYIRKLHDATKTRNTAAQEFLQGATPSNKRLVFMNGGTSRAHALCIQAIMQHETNGDVEVAEAIFKDAIEGGTAGLETQSNPPKRWTGASLLADTDEHYRSEDPVTRAMRAAEALDRLTASLQPSTELDLTIARPRSSSLPMYGFSDGFRDSAPFYVFGAQDQEEAHEFLDEFCDSSISPTTSRRTLSQYDQLFQLYESPTSPCSTAWSPRSPTSCNDEDEPFSPEDPWSPAMNTPWSDIYSPFSPRCSQVVTYGEASVLDMRGSSRKVVRRVRSLDRVYSATPKYRDVSLSLEALDSAGKKATRARPNSCAVEPNVRDSWNQESKCIDGPRTIFVKPKRPTINTAPLANTDKRNPLRCSETSSDATVDASLTEASTNEPLLPFTEDLVIYFRNDTPDFVLESVIASFKAGAHPDTPSVEIDELFVADQSLPQTPQSSHAFQAYRLSVVSEEPAKTSASDDDYDPFAYTHPTWPQPKSPQRLMTKSVERPPTPARTPTPSMLEQRECFHDFHITSQQTAVTIQNTLRSVLNVYYPPESQNYRHFQSLLPEVQGLWNTSVQESEPESPGRNLRTIDQIVAIGAQEGVSKGFWSRITGQLEKLGAKPSGPSRAGKLDFRYLLAKAMQAFTAQPLANQTCDNPFNNPYLLATLIVPHLETYLALHPESRFLLLEYPQEHLATVLALQNLVGVDVVKVAQIVNTKSAQQLPFTHIRGASSEKNADDLSVLREHKRPPSSSTEVTFDRANFILTSTATEAEIDEFMATVLKILTDISPFYKPEEGPRKPTILISKPPLSFQATSSSFSRPPSAYTRPVTSHSAAAPSHSLSPTSLRRSSLGETIDSATTPSRRSGRRRRDSLLIDHASAYTFDLNTDQDLDMEERRLMPMYMHKPKPSKGNSSKALKFLGLA